MRPTHLVLITALAAAAAAQGPPANGPVQRDPGWHALVGGTVVTRPGERVERATLVIRGGRVLSVTADGAPPAGARVHDCAGLVLYPGLIEPLLTVDAPPPDPDAAAAHWNPMVVPQRSALDGDGAPAADRQALRALGFAAAAIAPTGGILKGTAAVVLLDEPEAGRRARVVREACYALASLQRGGGDGAPTSEMGAIAVLRQALADADWHRRCAEVVARHPALRSRAPAADAATQALVDQRELPLCFDLDDELQALRVARVAREFDRTALLLGTGMEFRRLEAIAATALPVLVPLHLPAAPDVSTLAAAHRTSLRQLQSWAYAESNLARLLAAEVPVALTTARLPDRAAFRRRLAAAMACGVDADRALAALTTTPARLLGVADDLGTLEPGRIANVVVVAGDLFDPAAPIRAVWVAGHEHEVTPRADDDFDGAWTMTLERPQALQATLTVADGEVTLRFGDDAAEIRAARQDGARLEFLVTARALAERGTGWCRLRLRDGRVTGELYDPDGGRWPVRAVPAAPGDATDAEPEATAAKAPAELDPLPVPLGGYGTVARPQPQTAVFAGAVLWTCGPAGTVVGDLFVQDGRIVYAGPRDGMPTPPPGTPVIDCSGKHITPGIIDCHSHTGISRGVNESSEAVTAEVRVADVIDPDDVNWYRQLAGGVTAVNQLHGSANVIGGQSCTVKLRWGARHPDEMVLAGGAPGIKFALGENPRRANGRGNGGRYPNTRMGVEALLRDRFLAAADYARRWQRYEALEDGARAAALPPRRDLELEALAEVLAGRRRVHCHSYRQDEIFMLCGLATELGFRIGTFQHVLEGYKVAPAIREAAVGASSFSDWWGYKFEVFDAIPENGAILHEVGVNVSFNSDSSEHARRLNTEAGKAVKYGGVAPDEALKFVTLNPAIQLGVADRTGSLEAGKDADFAIWSDDPLRYAAICEATWVDGAPMFTLQRDRELRATIARERQRLLQQALAAAGERGGGGAAGPRDAYWAAEDLDDHYCCRDCQGGRR